MDASLNPSDLSDALWRLIAPLIPATKPGCRPRKCQMRQALNDLFAWAE